MSEPPAFNVGPKSDQIASDWQTVAEYLLQTATAAPLTEPDITNASKSEAEAIERAEKIIAESRSDDVTKYAAIVIRMFDPDVRRNTVIISTILTREPDYLHLSAVSLKPPHGEGHATMHRLDDDIVAEMLTAVLGADVEERIEGAFPQVRNFYKQLQ